MKNTSTNSRLPGLDIIRGILVVAMIIYHALYLLSNVFGVIPAIENDIVLRIFTGLGGGIFVLIAGISAALAYDAINKKGGSFTMYCLKRFIILFVLAGSITLGTYIFEPKQLILFGILHFFAVGFLLLPLFSRLVWGNLFSSVVIIGIGIFLLFFIIEIPYIWMFGVRTSTFFSADYYPIFPYFGALLLGFFFGKKLIEKQKMNTIFGWNSPLSTPIRWLGRNSLIIYLLHVPILYGVFWLIF